MGNAGSAVGRFQRALRTGDLRVIDMAARELPHGVPLDDALTILVLMSEDPGPRYERAAARWAGRLISERRLDLADSRRVLALVDVLPAAPGTAEVLRRYVTS